MAQDQTAICMYNDAQFQQVLARLRRITGIHPVVLCVPSPGYFGWANSNNLIVIDPFQTTPNMVDTMVHEFAHLMVWKLGVDAGPDEHGVGWRRIYKDLLRQVRKPQ